MEIKEARKAAGLTQRKMSELLEIPVRTIQDWERGISTPPRYVKRMLIKELQQLKEKE